MKFLPSTRVETPVQNLSGFSKLEAYIDNTKQNVADNLPQLSDSNNMNLTVQQASLYKLKMQETP